MTYPVRGLYYGPTPKVVTLDLVQEQLPKYITGTPRRCRAGNRDFKVDQENHAVTSTGTTGNLQVAFQVLRVTTTNSTIVLVASESKTSIAMGSCNIG